jgi:hypothetical protein
MLSPSGETITIPSGVFEAFKDFLISDRPAPERPTGEISITFTCGSVAGIKGLHAKKYNGLSK